MSRTFVKVGDITNVTSFIIKDVTIVHAGKHKLKLDISLQTYLQTK